MDQPTTKEIKEAIRTIHKIWYSAEAAFIDIDIAFDLHQPLCTLFDFAGITVTRNENFPADKLDLTTEEFNALTKTQEEI